MAVLSVESCSRKCPKCIRVEWARRRSCFYGMGRRRVKGGEESATMCQGTENAWVRVRRLGSDFEGSAGKSGVGLKTIGD